MERWTLEQQKHNEESKWRSRERKKNQLYTYIQNHNDGGIVFYSEAGWWWKPERYEFWLKENKWFSLKWMLCEPRRLVISLFMLIVIARRGKTKTRNRLCCRQQYFFIIIFFFKENLFECQRMPIGVCRRMAGVGLKLIMFYIDIGWVERFLCWLKLCECSKGLKVYGSFIRLGLQLNIRESYSWYT